MKSYLSLPKIAIVMSPFSHWILAARPKTLWAGLCPVVIGLVLSFQAPTFHWLTAALTLAAALLIQIGTNFANDYFDFKKGADSETRVGPTRATQSGLISETAMKRAFMGTFMLAFLCGIYLMIRGGWPIIMIGIVSIICGYLYTGGPYPIGYLGLGDIFVLIFFGPVAVGGTFYLQTGTVSPTAMLIGISPGLLSAALLVVNNLRDMDEDKKVGKNTLAVRFGALFVKIEYAVSLIVSIGLPIYVLMAIEHVSRGWLLATLFVPSLLLIRQTWLFQGERLNHVLASTAKLQLLFTIFFSVLYIFAL